MCGTIRHTLKNETAIETRLKLYKTVAVLGCLYASELWAVTGRYKNDRIRFLRSTTLGVTRIDTLKILR